MERMEPSIEAMTHIPARMAQAWARGDAPAFFADFTPDAIMTEFDGTILRGRDEMIAATQPVFDTVMKGSRLLRGEVLYTREAGEGVGVLHNRFGIAVAGEEEPPPHRFHLQLFVTRWLHDRWQVVALQNSRQVSMETAGLLESAGHSA
jgi:uncharacterized protein (TIGR02246 family)